MRKNVFPVLLFAPLRSSLTLTFIYWRQSVAIGDRTKSEVVKWSLCDMQPVCGCCSMLHIFFGLDRVGRFAKSLQVRVVAVQDSGQVISVVSVMPCAEWAQTRQSVCAADGTWNGH
jgi:hypothetical protein